MKLPLSTHTRGALGNVHRSHDLRWRGGLLAQRTIMRDLHTHAWAITHYRWRLGPVWFWVRRWADGRRSVDITWRSRT